MHRSFQGQQGLLGFVAFFQANGLQNRNAMLLRQLFDRGCLQFHAAAGRAIRLRAVAYMIGFIMASVLLPRFARRHATS